MVCRELLLIFSRGSKNFAIVPRPNFRTCLILIYITGGRGNLLTNENKNNLRLNIQDVIPTKVSRDISCNAAVFQGRWQQVQQSASESRSSVEMRPDKVPCRDAGGMYWQQAARSYVMSGVTALR